MSEKFESLRPEEHMPRYEVSLNQKNEILLDIPLDLLDLKMVESFAARHDLSKKDEFHVTLVGGKGSSLITVSLSKSQEDKRLREKMRELAQSIDWEVALKPIFYYLNRTYDDPDSLDPQKTIPETRETIIQLVDVPQLQEFHDSLRKLLGIDDVIPVLPHVTIFSNSSRPDKKQRGIGIYSPDDLVVSNAEKIKLT